VALLFLIAAAPEPTQAQESRFQLPETDEGLPGAGPLRRYDWFQKLWAKKRSAWAERLQQDQGAVVFLGDSITQGWGDDLGGAFPKVKVANRGISGDTTRGLLIRLADDVLALDPAGIVLLIGTNDVDVDVTPADIAGTVKLLLEQIAAHDDEIPVILCLVLQTSAT
jgi:lysophospholipase L1-like esterase